MTPSLVLDGIGVDLRGGGRRESVRVLDDVDLVLHAGRVRALVGLNGAGKTTLMRVALGMLRPDRGTVTLLGRPVREAGAEVWRRCGHLVETPFCYPELTARENLHAAATLRGLTGKESRRRADAVAQRLGLGRWLDRRARTLSLGTRQKVAIGAATLHAPDVLVLDEPANALDPRAVLGLRDLVRDLAAGGAAILVSSHHLDEVARMADDVDVLHAGRVVGTLAPGGADLERRFFDLVLAAEDERAEGDRPEGNRSQGERAEGDRPEGDRSQGERAEGEWPQGHRAEAIAARHSAAGDEAARP
ncbi:ABC transporter ATP-binding protein [Agilicoccus flavus]|uniref:ABC transporter ATP-binding protein n=1 Tax=Agilicoccus flavus TaxID=2775968 RepID=UPI001CF6DD8E|nr:ABC transporter ATP-binding protein [Agilicoccus flavus]